MRRVTKKLLFFICGVLFAGLYCEYLIYYVVIAQCSWPVLKNVQNNNNVLKALVIADTHLLGPRKGHWLDKLRREWQMHRAFQSILTLHSPEAVFVLGDLFDEGEWSNEKQFADYVERFYRLFAVPEDVSMHVVAGNHDIGFHHNIRRGWENHFAKKMNSTSSVQFLTLKQNHFVLINSMAMEGDSCNMCRKARTRIENISEKMKCSQYPNLNLCQTSQFKRVNYSRPIIMQHFPLHRKSDSICTDPDAPPLPERNKAFRPRIDALSLEASEFLISKIKPRVMFGGHTHHGCLVLHDNVVSFYEYSVPSFSWRNRPDPKFMLVTITPEEYAVTKCGLPMESTIALSAVMLLLIISWCTFTTKLIGR